MNKKVICAGILVIGQIEYSRASYQKIPTEATSSEPEVTAFLEYRIEQLEEGRAQGNPPSAGAGDVGFTDTTTRKTVEERERQEDIFGGGGTARRIIHTVNDAVQEIIDQQRTMSGGSKTTIEFSIKFHINGGSGLQYQPKDEQIDSLYKNSVVQTDNRRLFTDTPANQEQKVPVKEIGGTPRGEQPGFGQDSKKNKARPNISSVNRKSSRGPDFSGATKAEFNRRLEALQKKYGG